MLVFRLNTNCKKSSTWSCISIRWCKKLSIFYTSDFQAMKWSWLLEKLKGSLRNTLNEWLSFKGHTLIWINEKKYLGYTSDS